MDEYMVTRVYKLTETYWVKAENPVDADQKTEVMDSDVATKHYELVTVKVLNDRTREQTVTFGEDE